MDEKKKILIVDDDPNILIALQKRLEKHGFNIRTAESGMKALKILESYLPDLIISDVLMPEMDGFEFCKRVRSNPRFDTIPFLFLTLKSEVNDKVFGLELGADDYITKPVHMSELLARINSLFRLVERSKSVEKKPMNLIKEVKEIKAEDEDKTVEINRGLKAIKQKQYNIAINIFEELAEKYPDDSKIKDYLIKSRQLFLKDLFSKPKAVLNIPIRRINDFKDLVKYNFSIEESYVYSIIDGNINIKEIVQRSGIDKKKTMETLFKLFEKGVIEFS